MFVCLFSPNTLENAVQALMTMSVLTCLLEDCRHLWGNEVINILLRHAKTSWKQLSSLDMATQSLKQWLLMSFFFPLCVHRPVKLLV